MPNKYSHAFVLSNYESHGIIDFDRPQSSKTSSPSTSHRSPNSQKSVASSSKHPHPSTPIGAPDRIRLSASPSPEPKPTSRPFHSRSSSAETQIYAPIPSLTPPPTRRRNGSESLEHNQCQAQAQSTTVKNSHAQNIGLPSGSQTIKSSQDGIPSHPPTHAPKKTFEAIKPLKLEKYASQGPPLSQSMKERSERPSTRSTTPKPQRLVMPTSKQKPQNTLDVAAEAFDYAPPASQIAQRAPPQHRSEGSGPPLPNMYSRIPLSARAFVPERPPSPPDTPNTGRSFSLSAPVETPNPTSSQPLPPMCSTQQGFPERTRASNLSTISKSNDRVILSRPRTPPAQKSPTKTTFSMTTQSSMGIVSKEPVYNGEDSRKAARSSNTSFSLFPDDDTDLESLPSSLDFNAMPWCDHNIGPAIFREGELNARPPPSTSPVLTRASSFDSAAPPPISLNRRMPPILTDMSPPPLPSSSSASPKTPKKPKPSLASLAFFRSAPKAILYSQTVPGTPPIPVSVSRTAAPSIPALFPGYKGGFPPSSQQQHDAPPPARAGRMSRSSQPKKKRGSSVPPRSSERRRSWFKTDQLDRAFGTSQPDVRGGVESSYEIAMRRFFFSDDGGEHKY